jgi:hypothetical protein
MSRVSVLVGQGFSGQLERAEVKFIGVSLTGNFDQRELGVRKLPPDREILRRNREPSKPEHVPARFGHLSGSLPTELGDHGSLRLEWT